MITSVEIAASVWPVVRSPSSGRAEMTPSTSGNRMGMTRGDQKTWIGAKSYTLVPTRPRGDYLMRTLRQASCGDKLSACCNLDHLSAAHR